MEIKDLTQGQTLTVTKLIVFRGETKRVRAFNPGQKLWLCSSFVYHNKGQVKLAKANQNMGDGVVFNWNDVKESLTGE